jgi:hypothetical protein
MKAVVWDVWDGGPVQYYCRWDVSNNEVRALFVGSTGDVTGSGRLGSSKAVRARGADLARDLADSPPQPGCCRAPRSGMYPHCIIHRRR